MMHDLTITDTELEAIRSVERYVVTESQNSARVFSDPIRHDVDTLTQLLSRLAPYPPAEEVASRPNGVPIAESRNGGDPQGQSVVDRGTREIELRWAKEAIGLVAVELNEAYAKFEITRDGVTIPGGLNRATQRLGEVLERLGLTGGLDDEIPF